MPLEMVLTTVIDGDGCKFYIVRDEADGYFYWRSAAVGDEAESDGPFDTHAQAEAALLERIR